MLSRKLLEYYFSRGLEGIQKEGIDVLEYIQERTDILQEEDICKKIYKLNYYVTDADIFVFATKHGAKRCIEVASGGICMPVLEKEDIEIRDFAVIVTEQYQNNSLYKVHELLHLLSTRDTFLHRKRKDIPCGIDMFSVIAKDTPGLLALNEGITDYFAHEICKEKYSKKFGYYKGANGKMHRYFFSILLVALLCYTEEKKTKLLEAYLANKKEYVLEEIERCFGREREEMLDFFARGEECLQKREEREALQCYYNDLLDTLDYYYENVYRKEIAEEEDFVEKYMQKFVM